MEIIVLKGWWIGVDSLKVDSPEPIHPTDRSDLNRSRNQQIGTIYFTGKQNIGKTSVKNMRENIGPKPSSRFARLRQHSLAMIVLYSKNKHSKKRTALTPPESPTTYISDAVCVETRHNKVYSNTTNSRCCRREKLRLVALTLLGLQSRCRDKLFRIRLDCPPKRDCGSNRVNWPFLYCKHHANPHQVRNIFSWAVQKRLQLFQLAHLIRKNPAPTPTIAGDHIIKQDQILLLEIGKIYTW